MVHAKSASPGLPSHASRPRTLQPAPPTLQGTKWDIQRILLHLVCVRCLADWLWGAGLVAPPPLFVPKGVGGDMVLGGGPRPLGVTLGPPAEALAIPSRGGK